MSKGLTLEHPLNGWREFGPDARPWSSDCIYWAFRLSDRMTFPMLYQADLGIWIDPATNWHLQAEDVDFYLPVSAFPPPAPDQQVFRNPLPVVVLLVMSNRGLVAIRRALKDGFGKLALPGGFHNLGETWQEAVCREMMEETGVELDPANVRVYDVVTVENGTVNLIFGVYGGIVIDPVFSPDDEVMEVVELVSPTETAFPAHTEILARYLSEVGSKLVDTHVTDLTSCVVAET